MREEKEMNSVVFDPQDFWCSDTQNVLGKAFKSGSLTIQDDGKIYFASRIFIYEDGTVEIHKGKEKD